MGLVITMMVWMVMVLRIVRVLVMMAYFVDEQDEVLGGDLQVIDSELGGAVHHHHAVRRLP